MSQSAPDRVDAAVSYSRADQARVEPLIAGLKARGLVVWFDKDIPGGALWEEIIARKYRASGALLFFVSRDSLASQRCSEEVSTARTLGKPIITLELPQDAGMDGSTLWKEYGEALIEALRYNGGAADK